MTEYQKDESLKFTFYSMLFMSIIGVFFTLAVMIANHQDEIAQCRVNSGFTGLEAKALCRR